MLQCSVIHQYTSQLVINEQCTLHLGNCSLFGLEHVQQIGFGFARTLMTCVLQESGVLQIDVDSVSAALEGGYWGCIDN